MIKRIFWIIWPLIVVISLSTNWYYLYSDDKPFVEWGDQEASIKYLEKNNVTSMYLSKFFSSQAVIIRMKGLREICLNYSSSSKKLKRVGYCIAQESGSPRTIEGKFDLFFEKGGFKIWEPWSNSKKKKPTLKDFQNMVRAAKNYHGK